MFKGSITALITPFQNGAIDWQAFDQLIEWQVAQGSHGLVVCGTTGEAPTLTDDEHSRIVERSLDVVKGRIPVIAGTGSYSTAKATEMTLHAQKAGVDGALIVTPYYNKPTQEGLFAHFSTIARETTLPIILYNIPGRSVVDMTTETMAQLAKLPSIIGVKDATGDLERVTEIRHMIGDDFLLLSGEDGIIYDFLEKGGHGCISVTSNIAPALCAQLHDAWMNGDKITAKTIHEQLVPLHKALFVETSPAPTKYAASALELCSDEMRLPMLPASDTTRQNVDDVMITLNLAPSYNKPVMQSHG